MRECFKKGKESEADDSLVSKSTNFSKFILDPKWKVVQESVSGDSP